MAATIKCDTVVNAASATNNLSLDTSGNVTVGNNLTVTGTTTLTTPLSVSQGGTGLTSLTAGYIPYGNGTGAFSSSSNFTFNGTTDLIVPKEIYSSTATDYIRMAGGNPNASGAYFLLFGQSHATAPGRLSLRAAGSGDAQYTTDTGVHVWFTGGSSERMRIASDGSVGIGTASPGAKLEVYSTSAVYSRINSATTAQSALQIMNNSGANNFYFGIDTSAGGAFGGGAYGRVLYSDGAYPMVFFTNGSERARFNAGAPILCLSGGSTTATGTGIAFPATQSSSSDVNTLDDYEEGTWTPTVTGVSGTGIAYTGVYTKIGRIVYCSLTITGTSLAGTNITSTQPFSGTAYGVGNWVSGGAASSGIIQSVPFGNTAQFGGTFSAASVVNSNWIMTVAT